jgi:hypothetical protein
MSDEPTSPQFGAEKGPIAGAGLPRDAELVFVEWLASLEYQDVRYHEKVIGLLARQAMIDDDLRQKILTDPAGALRDLGSDLALPEEFSVRFRENTATELNVVLPPRAKMITDYFETLARQESQYSTGLRERLQSRTAARMPTLFQDDWNLSDAGDDLTFGMLVPPA